LKDRQPIVSDRSQIVCRRVSGDLKHFRSAAEPRKSLGDYRKSRAFPQIERQSREINRSFSLKRGAEPKAISSIPRSHQPQVRCPQCATRASAFWV
jgi:hypothetical protein